jgi:hypothetical protein
MCKRVEVPPALELYKRVDGGLKLIEPIFALCSAMSGCGGGLMWISWGKSDR